MKRQLNIKVIFFAHRASLFLVLFLQLVACPLWGQVIQKKALTVADYPKWGELTLNKMNPEGQWITYSMHYQSGTDTLFVKNTKTSQNFIIPMGNNGDFLDSDWFMCKIPTGIHLINLKSAKQETIFDVAQYNYFPNTKELLILIRQKEKDNELLLRTLDGTIREKILGVAEFVTSPSNQAVVYTIKKGAQSTIKLLNLSKNNQKKVVLTSSGSFNNLVWDSKSENAVAFIQKSEDISKKQNSIFYYNLQQNKLYSSIPDTQRSFLGDSLYITDTSYNLQISDDAQRVFFIVRKKIISEDSAKGSEVQLWNGNDKWIYPMEQIQKSFKDIYLAQWNPLDDQYTLISNDTLSRFMLTGDQKYALLYNPKKYEPQYKEIALTDYYITDLSSGKCKPFLKEHSAHLLYTIPSPGGKYIAYFNKKNWWVYDTAKQTHTNITQGIGHSFFQNKDQHPHNEEPYAEIGWTKNDKEILIYDAFDIWAITPNGGSARRLTQGREIQTQFRFGGGFKIIQGKSNYNGWTVSPVDLSEELILKTTAANGPSGFYKWSPKLITKLIDSDTSKLDQFFKSKSSDTFVYREQRYDLSPRILVKNSAMKLPQLVFKSNPQQESFQWGYSEIIEYKNAKEKSLKGILYYPAGYSKDKKYPMIVYIYEKMTDIMDNKYIIPSQFTGDGMFNITTFTTQGYLVLAPDISYEIGDPGVSAADCVVSATNEIIKRGIVQPDKIGLTGHSFGGYETDFIITQTNLFAAAVSGAAVTDLTSFYLSKGTASGKPEIWRSESQQWRMGKSLFEDRAGYNRNSPIEHVMNITTPLFSWTGGSDRQIHWHQSVEYYLALRRLQKMHIMAVYPKEDHNVNESVNQKDLSVRLHEWFDYYLKDMPPAAWIKAGIK